MHDDQTPNSRDDDKWDMHVEKVARSFPYPPTPNVSGAVLSHLTPIPRQTPARLITRWAVAALIGVIVFTSAMIAVPEIRAAVLRLLRIGAFEIEVLNPALFPTLFSTLPPVWTDESELILRELDELAGETTLAGAESQFDLPILMPPSLGTPDRVFYQRFNTGGLVILAWTDDANSNAAPILLYIAGEDVLAYKLATSVENVTVNGDPALWIVGDHPLYFVENGRIDVQPARIVVGHVLIWEQDGATYRLESELTLEAAVALAESMSN